MRISAVPLFRRLATQIGPERMQAHLDAFAYGNKDMSGGQDLFWLDGGGLRISAAEQVEFLTKLLAGTLPVKPEAMATVRAALPTETASDATLHWKTGTARQEPEPWTAWLVGWVERSDGNHVFACWLEVRQRAGIVKMTPPDSFFVSATTCASKRSKPLAPASSCHTSSFCSRSW
jgi:beta-lactamase class D